jgi:hypothetical protein
MCFISFSCRTNVICNRSRDAISITCATPPVLKKRPFGEEWDAETGVANIWHRQSWEHWASVSSELSLPVFHLRKQPSLAEKLFCLNLRSCPENKYLFPGFPHTTSYCFQAQNDIQRCVSSSPGRGSTSAVSALKRKEGFTKLLGSPWAQSLPLGSSVSLTPWGLASSGNGFKHSGLDPLQLHTLEVFLVHFHGFLRAPWGSASPDRFRV